MKVLITGCAGFIGTYLAEYLITQGHEVHGWHRPKKDPVFAQRLKGVALKGVEICDAEAVSNELAAIKPDVIFHFAAKSHIGLSWQDPTDTLVTNITGQINILEALKKHSLKPRVIIAGSSEQYGLVAAQNIPVNEEVPLNPVSPYAVSKVSQDLMGAQYEKNYGIPVIRIRFFNQTGPGRSESFVTSAFAQQVASIEAGLQEPVIHTGNLEAVRDFTDVRDTVIAVWLAAQKGEPGEVYNICSGEGQQISDILKILSELSAKEFKIQSDEDRMRPSDLPILIGDGTKFFNLTGWKPVISFRESMEDLLNYWRKKIEARAVKDHS